MRIFLVGHTLPNFAITRASRLWILLIFPLVSQSESIRPCASVTTAPMTNAVPIGSNELRNSEQRVGWVEPFAKPIIFALMGIALLYPSYGLLHAAVRAAK